MKQGDKSFVLVLTCVSICFIAVACSKEEDTPSDELTVFGVSRTMMIDDLTADSIEAYCQWILDKMGGAGKTISCPKTDEDGDPILDPSSGAQVEDTYNLATLEACVTKEKLSYPCSAGAVEDCFESYSHDWCAEGQGETEECEALKECLAANPPSNASTDCKSLGCQVSYCYCTATDGDTKYFCDDPPFNRPETDPCPGEGNSSQCDDTCP